MAQTNVEQYREEMGPPSASSAGNGLTAEEQGMAEQHLAHSQPPSSCVGYGGGDDRYHKTPNLPTQGYWEETDSGENEEQSSGYGQDRRGSGSGTTTTTEKQPEEGSRYGTVDPNAKPFESGFGSSGPGGYPDDGRNAGSYGAASSRSSGVSTDGSEAEVRGGVPHRVTSNGVASGAGLSDGVGRSPTPDDIKKNQYHLGEVAPSSQKASPYSQQLTQPDESSQDRFQEDEGILGNTKGGTAADQQKEAAGAEDGEDEGFLKRLVHKFEGHGHQHEVTDDASDIKHVDSGAVLEGDEDDKPGVITALKEKVVPTHEKHHDEIDPEIYE